MSIHTFLKMQIYFMNNYHSNCPNKNILNVKQNAFAGIYECHMILDIIAGAHCKFVM